MAMKDVEAGWQHILQSLFNLFSEEVSLSVLFRFLVALYGQKLSKLYRYFGPKTSEEKVESWINVFTTTNLRSICTEIKLLPFILFCLKSCLAVIIFKEKSHICLQNTWGAKQYLGEHASFPFLLAFHCLLLAYITGVSLTFYIKWCLQRK